MDILALTDRRYERATRRIVGHGATVITCPPVLAPEVRADTLAGHDIIYIDLHGQPDAGYLYNSEGLKALYVGAVEQASLTNSTVIATTCHLPETPFLQAFLDAGARVLAGSGANWGGKWLFLSSAQILAKDVIMLLKSGYTLAEAVQMARSWLARSWRRLLQPTETLDALAFRVYSKDVT